MDGRLKTIWKVIQWLIWFLCCLLFVHLLNDGDYNIWSEPVKSIDESSVLKVSYDGLRTNSENYAGELVYFGGRVLWEQKTYGNSYDVLVGTKQCGFFGNPFITSCDLIWVNYTGKPLIRGDYIGVWGKFKGTKTYKTNEGYITFITELDSERVKLIESASSLH